MPTGVNIDFNANLARFEKGLEKATRDMDKWADNIQRRNKKTADSFKKLGTIVGTALAGGLFINATKNAMDFADNIAKVATSTGVSAKRLQELRFAADQSGVGIEQLDKALETFNKRLGRAQLERGAGLQAFKQLGIDISNGVEPALRQAIDAISKLESEEKAVALTTELFGDRSQRLFRLFKGGLADLDAYADKANELGLVLSEDLVRGAEEANDQLAIFKQVISTQVTRVLVELAPVITAVGQAFADAVPQIAAFLGSFADVENQTVGALERTLGDIRSRIAEITAERERQQTGDANWVESILGFANTPEELDEEVDRLFDKFTQVQKRLSELRAEASKNPAKTQFDFSGLALGDKGVDKAAKAAAREAEQFAKSLQQLTDKLDPVSAKTRIYNENVEKLNRAWAEGKISGERYDQLIQLLATDTEALKKAQQDLARDQEKAFQFIKDIDPGSGIRDQIVEVQRLRDLFPELSDSLSDVEFDLQEKWEELNIGEIKKETDELQQTWDDLGGTFASAFEDAIASGGNLKDVLAGLEQDIIRIFTRELVTKPFANAISGFAGDLFGGGGGLFANLFPARAAGGPVMASQPYLVGEKGPELFVPRQPGSIIANGAAGGVINIYQTVDPGANPETFRRSARQGALEGSRLLQTANGIA